MPPSSEATQNLLTCCTVTTYRILDLDCTTGQKNLRSAILTHVVQHILKNPGQSGRLSQLLTGHLFKYPPYTVALGSEMVRVSKKEKLDVINVHYAIPHATAAYLNREIIGVPYVVTLHGSDVTILGSDPSYHPVNNHSVEQADAVTAVSDFMRREAYERLGVEREVKVIPNFVDSDVFKPDICDSDIEKQDNETVIIHVSNFRPVKRVPDY